MKVLDLNKNVDLYRARGNKIFVWTDNNLEKEELFLTLHQTEENPYTLEEQAKTLAIFLNKEFA